MKVIVVVFMVFLNYWYRFSRSLTRCLLIIGIPCFTLVIRSFWICLIHSKQRSDSKKKKDWFCCNTGLLTQGKVTQKCVIVKSVNSDFSKLCYMTDSIQRHRSTCNLFVCLSPGIVWRSPSVSRHHSGSYSFSHGGLYVLPFLPLSPSCSRVSLIQM